MLSHNKKDSNAKKRPSEEVIEDEPTPKMRKLAQGGVEHKDHKDVTINNNMTMEMVQTLFAPKCCNF